jgi:protein-S-isoprenylcysteine O-methyltransferase Ste14
MISDPILATLIFVAVMVCWFVFAFSFVFRKKPPAATDRKRDPGSIPGVLLQGLSYLVVWSIHRPLFTTFISSNKTVSIVLGMIAVAAAIGSVVLVIAAVKTLGKEWSITARVVTGHKLATGGPYNLVRHPIYTGMLGMLIATGIAVSYWQALAIATLVFLAGTMIRIRSEERLLRETFGAEFEAYAQRVPALLPGLF